MSYEFFIGTRYTRAKRRNHYVSFVSFVSVLCIALGMTVLITVLSVMNGFQREIRTRILGVVSHVQLSGANGQLSDWRRVAAEASKNDQVLAAAPFVQAQSLITNGPAVRGAYIRGILPDEENRVAEIGGHMKSGRLEDLKPGEFGIVLGSELARSLRVMVGDKIVLIAPQGQVTPAGIVPRLKQFTVVGIFGVDEYEFDSGLALMHLEDAQKLYRFGDAVSGVRLKLKDLFQSVAVARELSRRLGPDVYASDWTLQRANLLKAVQMEKRMMFFVVFLIIVVAAINIVSSLVMVVTDKQADIAILRTLGAAPSSIMKIFIIQGTIIGVVGTGLGLIGGLSLALNVETVVPFIESLFGFKFFAKDIYLISEVPSEVQQGDIILTVVFSFVVCLLATIYPSWRASRLKPADALRYE